MTVEEMIARADFLMGDADQFEDPSNSARMARAEDAKVLLMRADIEMRMQERRSAFAADAVKKLDASFRLYNFYPPDVVPLATGDGFLIHLSNSISNSRNGTIPWGDVILWAVNVTKTYAEAGWKIRFKLGDAESCRSDAHEFWHTVEPSAAPWKPVKEPMPYCCKCGAPRPVV